MLSNSHLLAVPLLLLLHLGCQLASGGSDDDYNGDDNEQRQGTGKGEFWKMLPHKTCGQYYMNEARSAPRISEGRYTYPGEYPSFVKIHFYGQGDETWFCGGTIISDRLILTAARCVKTAKRAVANSYTYHPEWSGGRSSISKFCLMRYYQAPANKDYQRNVAMLVTDAPIQFNEHIQPACLPSRSMEECDTVSVVGLGYTYDGYPDDFRRAGGFVANTTYGQQRPFGRRRKTQNPRAPDPIKQVPDQPLMLEMRKEKCPEDSDYERMCLKDVDGKGSVCRFDWGSPGYVTNERNRQMLVGIASHSKGTCLPKQPAQAVFANVNRLLYEMMGMLEVCGIKL